MHKLLPVHIAFLLYTLFITCSISIVRLYDDISKSLNIGDGSTIQMFTVFAISVAITAPISLLFFRKYSMRVLCIIGCLIIIFGNEIIISSQTLLFLLVGRITVGFGAAICLFVGTAIPKRLSNPEDLYRINFKWMLGLPVSFVVIIPALELVADSYSWTTAFRIISLFSGVCILSTFFNDDITAPVSTEFEVRLSGMISVIKKPAIFVLLILFQILQVIGQTLPFLAMTKLNEEATALSNESLLTGFMLIGLAGGAAIFVGNHLGKLKQLMPVANSHLLLSFILVFIIVDLYFLTKIKGIFAMLIIFPIWGAAGMAIFPVFLNVISDEVDKGAAIIGAVNPFSIYLGMAIAGLVAGYSINVNRIFFTTHVSMVCCLICLILCLYYQKTKKF